MDPRLEMRPKEIVEMFWQEVIDIAPEDDLRDPVYFDLDEVSECYEPS